MRTIARGTAALLCMAAGPLFLVPAAHAAPVAIVCAIGSQTASYSPPVTNTPRATHVRIQETYNCTSPMTGVSSGIGSASFQEVASCFLTVQPGITDVINYQWNTGRSSTITFNRTTVARALNGTTTVTSLGTVSRGLGQGNRATRLLVLPTLDLVACATTGVAAQTGLATLEVL